jgi:hypothetical protein
MLEHRLAGGEQQHRGHSSGGGRTNRQSSNSSSCWGYRRCLRMMKRRRRCVTAGHSRKHAGVAQEAAEWRIRRKTWQMCKEGRRRGRGMKLQLKTWMWSLQHWEPHNRPSSSSSSLIYPPLRQSQGCVALSSSRRYSRAPLHSSRRGHHSSLTKRM